MWWCRSSKAHELRVDTNLFELVYVKYLLLEWRQVVLRILKLVILSEGLQLHHNRVQNVRPDTGACKAVSADWAGGGNSSSNWSPETRTTVGGSSCRNTCICKPPSLGTSHPYFRACLHHAPWTCPLLPYLKYVIGHWARPRTILVYIKVKT